MLQQGCARCLEDGLQASTSNEWDGRLGSRQAIYVARGSLAWYPGRSESGQKLIFVGAERRS